MPPAARPGVREVADGIFLYTTRVTHPGADGPTFVYEVSAEGLYVPVEVFMGIHTSVDLSTSLGVCCVGCLWLLFLSPF